MQKNYVKPKIVDVIILSNCTSESYFKLNCNCIRSLIASEKDIVFNIILIESNTAFHSMGLSYDFKEIRIVIPGQPFNFNRFLNIGLKLTSGSWIVFSNNDVTFHPNWFSEILKIKERHPNIESFCPFDRTSPYLVFEKFSHQSHHIGYRVPVEFVGWCFVVQRHVFDKTGPFDENFDLYFQDNDFARTLKKHKILHAMVPSSFVEHLGGYTTGDYDASHTEKYAEDRGKFINKWGGSPLKRQLVNIMKKILRLY